MNAIHRVLTLFAIVLTVGCTESVKTLKTADSSASYFRDAQQCNRQSQFESKTKIVTKYFTEEMPIYAGVNEQKYQLCMETMGWRTPDIKKDPFFDVIAKCRESANIQTETVENNKLRVSSKYDAAAYDECVHSHGIEGEVIVHPLQVK